MNTETRNAARRIASILQTPVRTNTFPELAEMCANFELRASLERLVSWIAIFEKPTWSDEYLNEHGDASLRWLLAAEDALAASA